MENPNEEVKKVLPDSVVPTADTEVPDSTETKRGKTEAEKEHEERAGKLLREFADINTDIEESDFVRRRKEETEQAERDRREKAKKIQEDIAHDIVRKSEKKRELLDKRLELIDPKEDRVGLIKCLRDIQEAVLSHIDKVKDKQETNILSKKIQKHKVIDLYEFLMQFEKIKGQITHAVIDFARSLETEKQEINGRTEPYLVSEELFNFLLKLLTKLEKSLSRESFLKDYKEALSGKINRLKNPDMAEEVKPAIETGESDLVKEKDVIPEEGKLDLKKIKEGREANERAKFKVLFEEKVKIPLMVSVATLIKDCNFKSLDGEVELKVDTINSEPTLKVIAFSSKTKKEEIEESLKQSGLRFANIKEFLVLLRDYRSKVTAKSRKENKSRLKGSDWEDKMKTDLVSFADKAKYRFREYPKMREGRFSNKEVFKGFSDSFNSYADGNREFFASIEYYVVANIGIEELMSNQDSSASFKKIEIEGVEFEFGPTLGECYTKKDAFELLNNLNLELKEEEKRWRLPTRKDIKTWDKFEQRIRHDGRLSSDQKKQKILQFYKSLGFEIGEPYVYDYFIGLDERPCFAINGPERGIEYRVVRPSANYKVRVVR